MGVTEVTSRDSGMVIEVFYLRRFHALNLYSVDGRWIDTSMGHWWNDSARGKLDPVPLRPPYITYELGKRNLLFVPTVKYGRAMAQAVSRRPLTEEARVRS